MVSACTFHLPSWERGHDRHGKRRRGAGPARLLQALLQAGPAGRRGRPAPCKHGGVPVRPAAAAAPARQGTLVPRARPLASRSSGAEPECQRFRWSPPSLLPPVSPSAPRPTFLLLCVDVRRCLVSLLPARLYPPGNKALSASPAVALHLAQSGSAHGCLRGE